MYNQEQKKRFMDELLLSKGRRSPYIRAFEDVAEMENELGRDFCTFSETEVHKAINARSAVKDSQKVSGKLRKLRDYVEWCLDHKIDGATDAAFKLNIDSDRVEKQFVCSPEDLQQRLDIYFDPETEKTIDNTYRCYLWLAFAGVPQEFVCSLTPENIDLSTLRVGIGDDTYVLEREAVLAVYNCMTLQGFIARNRKERDGASGVARAEGN